MIDQEIQNKILLYLNKILFTQRLTIESRTSYIHIYMYVFIYACMYVCMYICMFIVYIPVLLFLRFVLALKQ